MDEWRLTVGELLRFYGAFNRFPKFLQYFIVLFIIFIVMLVGGILCYVFRQRVQTSMQQEMLRSIRLYGDDRAITRAWDDLQEGVRRDRRGRCTDHRRWTRAVRLYSFLFSSCFSYTVAASQLMTTGDSTGLAGSFPAAVAKRLTER